MKHFFILIILLVSILVLAACVNNDANPVPDSEEINQANEEETNTSINDDENGEAENSVDDESNTENTSNHEENPPEVVLENEAFKIFQPAPDSDVNGDFVVSGLARVFEGSVVYEF